MADSLILMLIALVVFGPRKLPQLGRQIGKLMYEFRKASNDFKFQMEEEFRNAEDADRRKREEAARLQPQLNAPAAEATPASTGSSSSGYGSYIQEHAENATPYPPPAASDTAPAQESVLAPDGTMAETTATEAAAEIPAAPVTVASTEAVQDQKDTEPTAHHG